MSGLPQNILETHARINPFDYAYLCLMLEIATQGVQRGDRTGTGTRAVFGRQLRFDLSQGFPLLTTKRIHVKSVIHELLWFLRGSTDNNELAEQGVNIWSNWATEDGSLGPIYGKQWRSWKCHNDRVIDQISGVIEQIRSKPYSRRLIVSAWNPADLPDESIPPRENVKNGKMALAPCHCLFQFFVAEGKLSCQLYQRSADFFLGVPFNIASYALLTHMIAQQCDLQVGEFIHTFGDVHLYNNHLNDAMAYMQMSREPRPAPQFVIKRKPASIFDYEFEDFAFEGYNPHPAIRAPIAM